MKTNLVTCWGLGTALFSAGIFSILQANAVWAPALVFLGCALLCAPVGLSGKNMGEIFSLPIRMRKWSPEEPLFFAKLFLHLSWIARQFGILEICDTKLDKTCSHPLYWLGKSLVIDGMDQEYTLHSMRIVTTRIHRETEIKMHASKQAGGLLFFVGAFGGIAATVAYAARSWNGVPGSAESVCISVILSFLFLMGSAILYLLVPARLLYEKSRDHQLEQQIIDGWLALQRGNSMDAIMREQYLFLSPKHRKAISEMPLLKEIDETEMNKYRSSVWENFKGFVKRMERDQNMYVANRGEGDSS